MRGVLLGLAALALAACDSGEVPPPGQEPLRPGNPDAGEQQVVLRADGLAAGPEAFYFAAGRMEVETALSSVLGAPSGTTENAECGAGPMQFTDYPGGLTANFQGGTLVGWNWRMPQDGDPVPAGEIAAAGDVQLATPRAEVEAIGGFVAIPDSTLGEEFALGDRVGGFFDADAVSMLYAGTQCFFR
ncbi:aspartate-semialdehyde dehydrogenase [Erythrobacter sp. JK5]|uniref:aspartate-semialdehyde dehydrogenase n=1 Tax=Erythrobacter sp. JK5 TaxID=2829500 RepID=UPI001BACA7C4|nr:aspartate-semialdehyde dehydrogenase [Erythrobacter sp. JK5]QUL38500.1 aspartate-semialdehyde dehydrogenase [Erythrobacter sp. JK5]